MGFLALGKEVKTEQNYTKTCNFFPTQFSLKCGDSEKRLLEQWQRNNLYFQVNELNRGNQQFLLHDGPPYANGELHIGHALNKVLKDATLKYKRMKGFYCPYVPGWDCHGLPIELKVTHQLGLEEDKSKINRKELRKACRKYAQQWVDKQLQSFVELGVMAEWNKRYQTMSFDYEANILRVFSKFVEGNFVTRRLMTVPWCYSCETSLSKSEMEYKNKKDPSCYVMFSLTDLSFDKLKNATNINLTQQVHFLAWTTTPWTLPFNQALVLHPKGKYSLVHFQERGGTNLSETVLLMANELVEDLCMKFQVQKKTVLSTLDSSFFLENKFEVQHPLNPKKQVPVLLDPMVSLKEKKEKEMEDEDVSGKHFSKDVVFTGVLHLAPGVGDTDYKVGMKYNLEVYSPLSSKGRYTSGVVPAELEGKSVVEGQEWVRETLKTCHHLLFEDKVTHSFPHCWRCKNPLIFRATKQYFCSIDNHDLLRRTRQQVEKIDFYDSTSKNTMLECLSNRMEWCLSRQRNWGVPIPALVCEVCDNPILKREMVEKVAEGVEREGLDYWENVEVSSELVPEGLECECGNSDLSQFRKETDVLDVWFDSGASHYAVVYQSPNLNFPCDLYLEGKDQYRGWFQSSFFCSMVATGKVCTKRVLTHGFIVDEFGKKISKSEGNGKPLEEVKALYNTDVLRLWVCSCSAFSTDVTMSDKLLSAHAMNYRKVRATCRFLLANLEDFRVSKLLSFEELFLVDQYMLCELNDFQASVEKSYEEFNYALVTQQLLLFCRTTLSAYYFEMAKMRLYFEPPSSKQRLSVQTVLYLILKTLVKLMSPVLSFLAEEVYQYFQFDEAESVFLTHLPSSTNYWVQMFPTNQENMQKKRWRLLNQVKSVVTHEFELKRKEKEIGSSLDAAFTLWVDMEAGGKEAHELVDFVKEFKNSHYSLLLEDFFVVSKFDLNTTFKADDHLGKQKTSFPWLKLQVEHAEGKMCPRCKRTWKNYAPDFLCEYCQFLLH